MGFNLPLPNSQKPNLNQPDFDQLVNEGVKVLYEKALQCPCKTYSQNASPTCKNCGGSGWAFVNGKEVMMLLQRMPSKLNIETFTFTNKGSVQFTCTDVTKITYMDRITRINAESVYTQVLKFVQKGNKFFAKSVYNPKRIEYIAFFNGDDEVYVPLSSIDYSIDRNFITLSDTVVLPDMEVITATIRYIHAPTFHVMTLTREAMDNWKLDASGNTLQRMPVTGEADKAEYALDQDNIAKSGILNNDYPENDCKDPLNPC